MAQKSHIFSRVAPPEATVIFPKSNIQGPVKLIFNGPMGADDLI
jgi:hypothetical protein